MEYDKDSNGFELPDFNQMLTELCHLEIPERVTNKLWSGIAKKAGVDSGVIQDSELSHSAAAREISFRLSNGPKGTCP